MKMLLIALTTLLTLTTARADWEAAFTAQSSKQSFPKATGRFFSNVDRFRVDTNVPFDLSLYARTGSDRVYAAVHSFKIRLSSNFDKFSAQIPACLSSSFADCVKRYSLKKLREAPCGEGGTPRTCEIYSGAGKGLKGVRTIELSHWKGEKEPILTSTVVTKTNGDVITTTFTGIGRKSHDSAFYSVPAKYSDAGTLEKFFGDFQGKSE